jgi:hypothetical protein
MVNMAKTKVMRCQVGSGQVKETGEFPCGVCRNSIECSGSPKWIHKRCSGVCGQLPDVDIGSYQCPRCISGNAPIVREKQVFNLDNTESVELVNKFCYLGDMLGRGGGVEEASRARVKCAWAKFNDLSPILTARGYPLRLKGKIYSACVQSVLVYGSETWAMKVNDVRRLERAENTMVRWMCGVTLGDGLRLVDLRKRLVIVCVDEVVRRGRLRWYGHVERKSKGDWVFDCRELEVEGAKGKGRGRKTWLECVGADMKSRGLNRDDAHDRTRWSDLSSGKRPTLPQCGREDVGRYGLRSRDAKR